MAVNAWTKAAQERSLNHAEKNGEYWDQRDVDLLFNLFDQGIPLSELIYAIVVLKQHLRRYTSDNGLVGKNSSYYVCRIEIDDAET